MLSSLDRALPAGKRDFVYGKKGREVLVRKMEGRCRLWEDERCWGHFGVGFVEPRSGLGREQHSRNGKFLLKNDL